MQRAVSSELWTHFIFLKDYILLPFYLIAIFIIFNRFCNAKYPVGHPWRTYFKNGFRVKIAGAIFIGLAYQYYYRGGDTSAFFYHANVINSALNESIFKWLNLVLGIPKGYDGAYLSYISQMIWYGVPNSYFVCSITAVVNIFTFNSFLPSSVIFGALSFSGNWAMFRTFAKQYPKYTRGIAIATLFIPSTVVWGSGIFKDTICLSALGWLTYGAFNMLVERKVNFKNIIILVCSVYVLSIVKVYILLSFAPALLLWISFIYTQRINGRFKRVIVKLFVTSFCLGGILLLVNVFAADLGRYSLDNIVETSDITRTYIFQVSQTDDASSYSLGNFDPTINGMLSKLPLAVNVTLFRPYLWEAKKPMVF
ncbi:MAG: hypothetical protein ABI378_14565, partial [Chitinophagaceae bacterium]